MTQMERIDSDIKKELKARGIPAHELRTKYIVYDEDKSRGNIAFDNGKKYSFSYIENTLRIGG